MIILIKKEDLFKAHQEFNQLVGMTMAVIDKNVKVGNSKKGTTIQNAFPTLTKITDQINKEMQKYAITAKES